jgi:hypothetical protein
MIAYLLLLALSPGVLERRAEARPQPATENRPPPARSREPDVGWCCFYPGADVGMDQLPASGASILSVCAGGWWMVPEEGKYDYSAYDRQLAYAQQHGLKLALINEINPVYTPAWLRAKAKAAGQAVRSASGTVGDLPSITSPLFREAQEEMVRRFVAHVRETDRSRTVAYYHPGAEWWFPMNERYNPADVARFREWLERRYQTIARLNAAWGARYTAFAEVPAPELEMMAGGRNRPGMAPVMALDSGAQHCSWSTPAAIDAAAKPGADTFAAVEPGKTYTASAWVKTEDVKGFGVFMEIAWVRASGGPPIAIDQGPPLRGTHGWTQVLATFKAPKEAGRAWMLLKLMGSGTATWDDADFWKTTSSLRRRGQGEVSPNIAPNPGMEAGGAEPAAWRFQNWSGGRRVESRWLKNGGRTGESCLQVTVQPAADGSRSYRNLDAAVYDWSVFWYETAAEYINGMSRLVKKFDSSRPTVTYLTFSFAYPAEWDYTQNYAIAPDEVAMRGRDIDAFGMQICAAGGGFPAPGRRSPARFSHQLHREDHRTRGGQPVRSGNRVPPRTMK